MDLCDLSPSAALALECERRFQGNVRALVRAGSAATPGLLETLRGTVLVVTYLERGRDGSIACRVETAAGDRRWVGGAVIPASAATEMLATLDLPEVGHLFLAPFDGGYNLDALLEATHQHQHIFVLEDELSLFAGTLMAADMRRAFASGRVRLFVGADLGKQVANYLREHPWMPPPEHLITTSTVRETVALYRHEVALSERLLAQAGRRPGRSQAA